MESSDVISTSMCISQTAQMNDKLIWKTDERGLCLVDGDGSRSI